MKTREAWLIEAIELLRPTFEAATLPLPENVRVSCGWPSRGGTKPSKRVIGQCWAATATTDNVPQIFISPTLDKSLDTLAVLVHELVHAVLPEAKHGARFRAAMKQIGLEGKPTATMAGNTLAIELEVMAERLGLYTNAQIDPTAQAADTPKTQKNRQLKIECANIAEHEDKEPYILRGAKKTLERGVPDCPLCGQRLILEEPEEKGE